MKGKVFSLKILSGKVFLKISLNPFLRVHIHVIAQNVSLDPQLPCYGITDFTLASNFYIQQPCSCSLSDPVGNAKPLQLIFDWSPNAKYLSLFIY